MKRAVILLLSFAFVTAAAAQDYGSKYRKQYEKEINGPHGECAVAWRKLQDGLDYRTISCLGDDELDLHVVRIDPKKWVLDTSVIPRGATARGAAKGADADFAINANFFDAAREPMGVVVKSGTPISASRKTSWQSIFTLSESGRARIVLPDAWRSIAGSSWMAVQAGPRLVTNGHMNEPRNTYAAPRAGVCIQWDRDLIFFATPATRKFHAREIAKVARRAEIDGGLACQEAMLFDGGHSVNLFVDDEALVSGDPVPVYVVAKPRQ
ncbi:MAG TPA: phosphodiester glycosidase family protein [Thermoanaerobaculia bacterium]|nr:phosphodiester glycosidase family protein [Thermoanaerobaculia bacterium]